MVKETNIDPNHMKWRVKQTIILMGKQRVCWVFVHVYHLSYAQYICAYLQRIFSMSIIPDYTED